MNWMKSSAILMALSPMVSAQAASFEEAMKKSTISGQFRLGYISVAADVAGAKTTTAAAFSGQIRYKTGNWNGFQFAIAPYFSEKLAMLSGDKASSELNGDFLNANYDSFAYLGEAYAQYQWKNGNVRFGRQQLETPFINSDDIRILPNTFNAAWFNMQLGQALSLDAGIVNRWAGFDAGSLDHYIKAKTDGVTAVGINYKASDALSAQAWLYDFSREYTLFYTDVSYTRGAFEVAAQYGNYTEQQASNIAGSMFGLKAAYTIGAVTVSAAMNKATNPAGKSVDHGLGGGDFYTSMDESTITGLEGASAQHLALSYVATEKLSVAVVRGHFENKGKTSSNNDETDINLEYKINSNMDMGYSYTQLDNKAQPTDDATNFSRHLLRINYVF